MPTKLAPVLKQYIWGTEEWMLSDLHEEVEYSPLLVKIITAKENLSVQVHPGNEYAMENENCTGKTKSHRKNFLKELRMILFWKFVKR